MGRDKKNKRLQRSEEASDEEVLAEDAMQAGAEAGDSDADADDTLEIVTNRFSEGVDNLSEKKSATRVSGLQQMLAALRSGLDIADTVAKYQETATSALLKLLRRPSSDREGVLACEVTCLLSLVLGGDEFHSCFAAALQTIITRQESEALRIAALKCYCFMSYSSSFISSALEFTASLLMMTSEGVYVTSALRAAAASQWCFLSTALEAPDVLEMSRGGVFLSLSSLLEDTTTAATEVKIAAGTCIAYLWEVADAHSPNLCAEASGELLCDDAEVVAATLALLRSISNESSKRISKKDKKETKAAFKAMLAWVIDGHSPSDMVRMNGADVVISSFERILLVDVLRDVLQSGFQSSLRVFPFVRY